MSEISGSLRKALLRFIDGDTPKCSMRDYEMLRAISKEFQLESRYGADRSGGMVLTALNNKDRAIAEARKLTGM